MSRKLSVSAKLAAGYISAYPRLMTDQPEQAATYEFTGPNEQGQIRLQMPNLDPAKSDEFFCVTVGDDKDALAEAMCRWLCENGYGEMSED